VRRHGLSVGAIPTRQLSFQPVAIGAVEEVTKRLEPPATSVITLNAAIRDQVNCQDVIGFTLQRCFSTRIRFHPR
jgi:hypothetical protein